MLYNMKKIDLSIYKEYKQYFIFYDIEIKKENNNKEEFLESKKIAPSSYRRAKNSGNKIGKEILEKLNYEFSFNMINDEIIDELECKLNEIYYDFYYKKNHVYEDSFKWIDEQLKNSYIIYPVLLVFKLFMLISMDSSPDKIMIEYKKIYEDVRKYTKFFNEDILDIYEIIDIFFQDEIDDEYLSRKYSNELSCYTLSWKCLRKRKYIEAIYFAEKIKNKFILEENIKRVFYINLNLMSAYNNIGRYEDCYFLAKKQMLALEAYKYYDFEYKIAQKHYIIACLGLGYYSEIINLLELRQNFNKTELWSLLFSKYKISKKDYEELLNLLLASKDCTDSDSEYLTLMDNIIRKKDKNLLETLTNDNVNKCLIKIIKKM